MLSGVTGPVCRICRRDLGRWRRISVPCCLRLGGVNTGLLGVVNNGILPLLGFKRKISTTTGSAEPHPWPSTARRPPKVQAAS